MAYVLQMEAAIRVVLEGGLGRARWLAALDASSVRGGPLYAACVLWDLQEDCETEISIASRVAEEVFPYVPGYLSFREAPVYLQALAGLSRMPQLLLVDGQGIAHPRRLGIAAHLGVHLDLPAIGVAKSRLVGEVAGTLPEDKGAVLPLLLHGDQVGWLYRSRRGVKPLYLSPGHRVSLETTLAFIRRLGGRFRLPEPLRRAHYWAGQGRQTGVLGRIILK